MDVMTESGGGRRERPKGQETQQVEGQNEPLTITEGLLKCPRLWCSGTVKQFSMNQPKYNGIH